MIKDILVHVDASAAGARRLDLALALANLTQSHLTGIHVQPPPEIAPLYKPSQVASAEALAKEANWRAADDAAQLFARRTETLASAEWRALAGDMIDVLSREAGSTDLVILGQYEWQGPATHHPLSLAEGLVERCGRPLLVVPEKAKTAIPKTALVAWDGSREAVRALHDALPLILASGATVEIAWFREHHKQEDLHRIRDHLTRHGVNIADLVALDAGLRTSERLLLRVNQAHFDFLIMGAFHHPAWFEFLFGGTTAAAMLKADVPVLVSH